MNLQDIERGGREGVRPSRCILVKKRTGLRFTDSLNEPETKGKQNEKRRARGFTKLLHTQFLEDPQYLAKATKSRTGGRWGHRNHGLLVVSAGFLVDVASENDRQEAATDVTTRY